MKRRPNKRQREDTHRRRNEVDRRRYCSARWGRLRKLILARDKGLCQECLRAGRTATGNQIDHIERAEERPDLFWRADNLQTLCAGCHSRKTVSGK